MLKDYAAKRHFEQTPEPSSFDAPEGSGPLRFVIQKHAARRLHYDLRLECDGTLKSWAVPKGPSYNPADKHLAVMVEDHPLGYATFEGQIPKGEYGGGEVIVWDEGVYTPDDKGEILWDDRDLAQKRIRDGIKKGKLSITFIGKKMKGSWALVRTSNGKDWLLLKHKDGTEDPELDITKEEKSVITGRTVEDVKAGRSGATLFDKVAKTKGAVLAPMPRTLTPMLLTEVERPFTNKDWSFELKLDGIRLLAFVKDGRVKLLSRNNNDATRKFPSLCEELSKLPDCILDAEVVVFDEEGKPTFQGLMERYQVEGERNIAHLDKQTRIEFCVFDLIYLGQWDLRKCKLTDRRALLEELAPRSPSVRVMDVYPEEGELLYEHATQLGFEGIVAKKNSSAYTDGKRSSEWVKIKGHHTDEFLVAGFTKGSGMRESTFGALILAKREEDGSLRFCGTVGGGFSDPMLEQVKHQLEGLIVKKTPFKGPIELKDGKPVWVEPRLWVEVKFMSYTREGRLRFPVFLRMRPDMETLPAQPESNETAVKQDKSGSEIDSVLEQLTEPKQELQVVVNGHTIRLSSLNKVLWPGEGDLAPVTKRDLVAYYAKMSDHLIGHLRDRPISFVRLPEGLGGERFFQKHWEKGRPDFIEVVPIFSSSNTRTTDYVLINNLETLVWMAQMSALEIHPWYSRITRDGGAEDAGSDTGSSEEALDESALNYPDFMVIDLDPMVRAGHEEEKDEPALNRAGWQMVLEVAQGVKEMLDAIGLRSYPKTSGKAGLHIYVPIKRTYEYEVVRSYCETLGRHLERTMPEHVTMEWSVKKRPEKVFFDHNQNVRGKTLSGPFTVRAVPGAPISMPLRWNQVATTYPTDFTLHSVPAYLATNSDPWADILKDRQILPGTE